MSFCDRPDIRGLLVTLLVLSGLCEAVVSFHRCPQGLDVDAHLPGELVQRLGVVNVGQVTNNLGLKRRCLNRTVGIFAKDISAKVHPMLLCPFLCPCSFKIGHKSTAIGNIFLNS